MKFEPAAQSASTQFTEEEARYLGLDLPPRESSVQDDERQLRFVASVMTERRSALR